MTDKVLVERNGPVTTIIINRPKSKNALDNEAVHALADALRAFENDPESCVAVLTGAGGAFCAGGLGVALFCDIRIVDDSAVFGVFSRRWGVPMSDGTTVRLPRVVGQGRALDMLLTGRAVGADEAIAIGLATRKVARGTTRAEAEKLAHQIAGFPPIAMTSDRQSAYESFDRDQQAAIKREMELSLEARRRESQKGAARFAQGAGRHGKFKD